MIHPNSGIEQLKSENESLQSENEKLKAQIRSLTLEKQDSQVSLKEKDEFLQAIYNNSDIGIYVIDVLENGEYRFKGINPAHEKLLNVKSEQLEGKGLEVLSELFGPEMTGYVKKQYDIVVESKTTQYVETNMKLNGKDTSWYRGLKPVFDKEGKVIRIIATATPITELKSLEKEKLQLEKQLRQAQKMEAIGSLAGGIAHDFNNILYPLLGYADILKQELPDDSPHHNYVKEILKASFRAKDLIQQILRFSRQGDQELKPIKIQTVLEEVEALLSSTIPKTVELNTTISQDCGKVLADPTQIHQVIMNLVTNAYHAMPDLNGKLQISLKQINSAPDIAENAEAEQYALLQISDNGTGIKKEHLEMIFDPYFTTKEKGKGTGLGLSVVHGIVKQFNGFIEVISEWGKGTIVEIYLPILTKKVSEKTKAKPQPETLFGKESVLLVDDEIDIIKIGKIMLEKYGYNVTIHSSSKKALAVFKETPDLFDIVLSDMTMPDLNGLQLSNEIKKIRKDLPVIICTGYSEQIDDTNSDQFNIDGFIKKPLIMKDVAAIIRDTLDT